MINTMIKSNVRRKKFIWLTGPDHGILREVKAGTQGRDLEVETDAEITEEGCLLAFFS